MKRIVIAALVLLGLLLVIFARWLMVDPTTPRFRATSSQPVVAPYTALSYEFLTLSPFEGGRMWIKVFAGTNESHCYLFDIDRRQILGELSNADPVFMNGNQSALLCERRASRQNPIREKITTFIERITRGKFRFPHPRDDVETFWLVDIERNSATKLGEFSQMQGAGTSFVPSPDFRYGFNKPSGSFQKPEFFLCDLEKKAFSTINLDGWPVGWWDRNSIVVKDTNNTYVLNGVITGKTNVLLAAAQVNAFLEEMKVWDDGPPTANMFGVWNGKENVFYLTDTHQRWSALESFLVEVERPGAKLKLLSREFKFEWSDHFHANGDYYVFSGREAGERSSGVFLRDLRSNTNRTLVPPDDSKHFSIPGFYRDSVIYIRSNMLWQVDLNGSNHTRLFPPP